MKHHQAAALWDLQRSHVQYPDGVIPVPQPIPGTAFFPGGFGIWNPKNEAPPPPLPVGEIMVLGHDFYSEAGYKKSLRDGHEPETQATWHNLLALLKDAGIDPTKCFFTNVYMGLRAGDKSTGDFPGAKDDKFVAFCVSFLAEQLRVQRPRVILTLGTHVPPLLARLSPQLEEWREREGFDYVDAVGPVQKHVSFVDAPGFKSDVVALTHPSERQLNVGRRRYKDLAGAEAEIAMIREATKRGKHNSSLTRVAPVFEALKDRDPTGTSWLPALLRLGSGQVSDLDDGAVGQLHAGHPRWWGPNEHALEPPMALLRWLVQNVKPPADASLWGGEATRKKRELLVARDPATIAEALKLLGEPGKSRVWYVLEGQSFPDAFVETERIVLVVEGKRTEREATASTTWMPDRRQMLRHMDAAWEIRTGRRVLGLMIVEGPGEQGAVEPSTYWLSEAEQLTNPGTLAASLPHRSVQEREEIASGFLGVATWQKVCQAFDLPWPPGPDVI